jgi:hypothetical protein
VSVIVGYSRMKCENATGSVVFAILDVAGGVVYFEVQQAGQGGL